MKFTRNKYNAKKTMYAGVLYDSKREAQHAMFLDSQVKANKIDHWTRQVDIPITINGVKVCKLVADFFVVNCDSTCEYHEVKGMELPIFRLKLKLLKALYPNIKYTGIK